MLIVVVCLVGNNDDLLARLAEKVSNAFVKVGDSITNIDKEEDDILLNGIKYTEKEGNYWVYVNVQTGVIEEISYSAAIGGNG